MRLTLMILAGFQKSITIDGIQYSIGNNIDKHKDIKNNNLSVFHIPLLPSDSISSSSSSSNQNITNNNKINTKINTIHSFSPVKDNHHCITVCAIQLSNDDIQKCEEDTIRFWLHSIVIFSDLCGVDVIEVSRNSVFCLRVSYS